MSLDAANAFLVELERERQWPPKREEPILTRLNTWAAIRDSDRDTLRRVADWQTRSSLPYRVDPLGERIAETWAHYLFGDDPRVLPGNDADAQLLGELLEPSELPSELERAAVLCSSEGEIWARVYSDPDAADHPLLEWVSRRNIYPKWVGGRLGAAAVVTELGRAYNNRPREEVDRHFEIHAPGVVLNVLFRGKDRELGKRVNLERNPQVGDLDDVWEHGLAGMLVGRIPNKLRKTRTLGRSDYDSPLDYLLDLNEAASIGSRNMRLTARKRAVISAAAAAASAPTERNDLELTPEEGGRQVPSARFDVTEEIFVEDPLDTELGKGGKDPYRILEYSFDAASLIEWKKDLVATALDRSGIVGQYAGSNVDPRVGYAISGTALRLRLIPTDKTGRGKARYWDTGLPRILATMQALDALPTAARGFARDWTDAAVRPTLQRAPGIPEDDAELIERESRAVEGGIRSIETAVRNTNRDRDDDWVAAEVERIRQDREASGGSGSLPTFP